MWKSSSLFRVGLTDGRPRAVNGPSRDTAGPGKTPPPLPLPSRRAWLWSGCSVKARPTRRWRGPSFTTSTRIGRTRGFRPHHRRPTCFGSLKTLAASGGRRITPGQWSCIAGQCWLLMLSTTPGTTVHYTSALKTYLNMWQSAGHIQFYRVQFFIQLPANWRSLSRIKRDHPVHIMLSKCPP